MNLVGKPEKMRLFVAIRCKWEESIKMNRLFTRVGRSLNPRINPIKMKPQEIACKSADWMKEAQDRFQWQASVTIVYTKLRFP